MGEQGEEAGVSPHQPFDRDFIMYEIENPTPAGVSTMPYGEQATDNKQPTTGENLGRDRNLSGQAGGQPPVNLPTKSGTEREIPVIRTMPRDVAEESKNRPFDSAQGRQQTPKTFEEQKLGGRGKFGLGTPPMLKQQSPRQTFEGQKPSGQANSFSPSFIPTKPGIVGGTLRGNQQQTTNNKQPERQNMGGQGQNLNGQARPAPKPSKTFPPQNSGEQAPPAGYPKTIPTPPAPATPTETKRAPFATPEKTDKVSDMVEDKLTKTVGVPSERKRYVVDPYREPLE